MNVLRFLYRLGIGTLIFLCVSSLHPARAQVNPPERVLRTYVPPDQLVSFRPDTPFNQFIELLNPIFERVLHKKIIDPENREFPIGIPIQGMYFLDAFKLVLAQHNLTYKESNGYYIIQEAPQGQGVLSTREPILPGEQEPGEVPARATSREIQIDAMLFEVNLSKLKEIGTDWTKFFKGRVGQGSNGGGGGGGGLGASQGSGFRVKTGKFLDPLNTILEVPETMDLDQITDIFRYFETEGIGQTLANPQITVQSGETGEIQVGADIPVQIRDFAGNTVTQLIPTGIIIRVTPTLIQDFVQDSLGNEYPIEFVHLNVQVEKSGGRVTEAGVTIDRNRADTQVLLLDDERTIIGGLYSSEETVNRKGIPILKDLPWWLFGLRYIFGYNTRQVIQKELVIVLGANIVKPLQARLREPMHRNLLKQQREEWHQRLQEMGATEAQIEQLLRLQKQGRRMR